MIQTTGETAQLNSLIGRRTSGLRIFMLLGPSLLVILLLFGGGLGLGLLQALGYQPGSSTDSFGLQHFTAILTDPDFAQSLGLTFYISLCSTVIAAIVSIVFTLIFARWAAENKLASFLLQIPLTVPHLVIAVAVMLLLTPAGLLSRFFTTIGVTSSAGSFPLLVNDPWCIGILFVYVWKEIPFITFMLLSVLKNAGPEILEVGATLNAGPLQKFRYIILPIIRPNLFGACLIVFAFTFGAFEVPYLLGRTYPMALPVWAYKNYSDVDLLARPEGIAIGLIIAATITLAVIIAQLVMQLGYTQESTE